MEEKANLACLGLARSGEKLRGFFLSMLFFSKKIDVVVVLRRPRFLLNSSLLSPPPPKQLQAALAQGVNVAQIVAAKNASLNALLARGNGSVAFMRR